MTDDFEIGSRETAVRLPFIMSVLPYIAKQFPEMVPDCRGKTLYHYTDSSGLLGIMSTDHVWASNYAFLNDPSERIYCISKTEEAMKSVEKGRGATVARLFDAVLRELRGEGIWNEYIASFCEEGDLLSQWRAYGGRESGYSIGFDASKLTSNLVQLALLKRVIYDPMLQMRILMEVCEIIAEFAERQFAERGVQAEMFIDNMAKHCAEPIWSLCAEMKHQAYAEEREWRLVYLRSTNDKENKIFDLDICFRARGSTIIPFVKIPFGERIGAPEGRDYYPIEKVVVGPMDNSGVAGNGVELLCKSKRKTVIVEKSKIPTRAF